MNADSTSINEAHKARWADAAAKHGGKWNVPSSVATELGEMNRLDWVAFTEQRDGNGELRPRRDKGRRMTEFCHGNVGRTVSVAELAAAADASVGTAYAFVNDNRSTFRKDGHGFVILDTSAERAAARAPSGRHTTPSAPRVGDPVVTDDVAIASRAIAEMTGDVGLF